MVSIYRTLQHWNHWLSLFMGQQLLAAERQMLDTLMKPYYGKHAVLVGVPEQETLLQASNMPCHVVMSGMMHHEKSLKNSVETEFYELPLLSSSVDLVVLPHTLEYVDNPRRLLSEACRIVKPEGHIIIFGFNPISLWGFRKFLTRSNHIPWTNHFIKSGLIKKWLAYADFDINAQKTFFFRPPTRHSRLFNKLLWLEWVGKWFYKPFGGVYAIVATATTLTATPIRTRWRQSLSALNAATRIPRPTTRNTP